MQFSTLWYNHLLEYRYHLYYKALSGNLAYDFHPVLCKLCIYFCYSKLLLFYNSTFIGPYQNKDVSFFESFMGDNDETYASSLFKAMLEETYKMVLRLKSHKHEYLHN